MLGKCQKPFEWKKNFFNRRSTLGEYIFQRFQLKTSQTYWRKFKSSKLILTEGRSNFQSLSSPKSLDIRLVLKIVAEIRTQKTRFFHKRKIVKNFTVSFVTHWGKGLISLVRTKTYATKHRKVILLLKKVCVCACVWEREIVCVRLCVCVCVWCSATPSGFSDSE